MLNYFQSQRPMPGNGGDILGRHSSSKKMRQRRAQRKLHDRQKKVLHSNGLKRGPDGVVHTLDGKVVPSTNVRVKGGTKPFEAGASKPDGKPQAWECQAEYPAASMKCGHLNNGSAKCCRRCGGNKPATPAATTKQVAAPHTQSLQGWTCKARLGWGMCDYYNPPQARTCGYCGRTR